MGRGVAGPALEGLLPVQPGDPAGAALGDALDGLAGAVVVAVPAAHVPVLDADHLLELRRKAVLAVARLGGDDADAGAVQAPADVPEPAGDRGVGDAEAGVDDVGPGLARVLQGGLQGRGAGREGGAEDADDGQLRLGSQAADDPGAGRAVAGVVVVAAEAPDRAVVVDPDRDAPGDVAREVGPGGVEAAVDDGDADTAPRQAGEGMPGHQGDGWSQE